jgi:tyrosinase
MLTPSLALKPFYAGPDGTFWTSNSAKSTKSFGYSFKEMLSSDPSAVRAAVNTLYGPTTPAGKRRALRTRESQLGPVMSYHATIESASTDLLDISPTGRLYQINFRAPKNKLGSSFFIDFFLGPPKSEDPVTWMHDPSLLGSQSIISMQLPSMASVTVTGVLPLNKKLGELRDAGRMKDLSEASVIGLLQDGITWRVRLVSTCLVVQGDSR